MIQLYEPETKLLAVNSDGVVAPPNMSYEQFLDWADEDTLAEWVAGVVEMTSPASLIHQNIAYFLGRVVGDYVETFDLGMVIPRPFR